MKKIIKNVALALIATAAPHVWAEEDHEYIKPLEMATDINGVDLVSGKYLPQLPTLSIPAAPRLSFQTIQKFESRIDGTWIVSGANGLPEENLSVTFGGNTSEFFECKDHDCIPANNTGSTILGNMGSKVFKYTQGKSGIKIDYDIAARPYPTTHYQNGTFYASKITYPDGEVISIEYDEDPSSNYNHRPAKAISSLGYQMVFSYASNSAGADWAAISNVTIAETSASNTILAEQSYSKSTNTITDPIYSPWGTASVTNTNNTSTLIDALGRAWTYSGFTNSAFQEDHAKSFTYQLPTDSHNSIAVSSAARTYDDEYHNNFVTSVTNNGATYNYTYTPTSGSQYDPKKQYTQVDITGPNGYKRTIKLKVYSDSSKRQQISHDIDALGNETFFEYNHKKTLDSITYPEGNKVELFYDANGNLTSKKVIAKPGSNLADIITTANYNINTCSGLTCFRPNYVIDANGKRTDYTFDAFHGGMLTKLEPANKHGVRRLTTNDYETIGGFKRLKQTSVCGGSECGTKNELVTKYTYWNDTHLPETITKTNAINSISQTVTYTYDAAGRKLSEDGPLAGTNDATFFRYDATGRQTWEIQAVNQKGHRVATKTTYRQEDNQVAKTEQGVLPSNWNVLTAAANMVFSVVKLTTDNEFNTKNLLTKSEISSTLVEQVTQKSYDASNRLQCEVRRMNPLKYNSLPSSACTLTAGDVGEFGEDRITYSEYDALSRLTKTISGYGTDDAGIDIEIGYTDNGEVDYRKDGNGNLTDYAYDGVDRLYKTTYPDYSYESNTYDNNGNLKTLRKRDGKVLTHTYDGLNLRSTTAVSGEYSIIFGYDGSGKQVSATRNNSSVGYTYDGLGRLETTSTNDRTLTYSYNDAGLRSELKHPDNFSVNYYYDTSGALTSIKENDNKELVRYGYDIYGRLETITRNNGTATTSSLGYNTVGQVQNFDHLSINDASFDYNPANQITNRVVSNASFQIKVPSISQEAYEVNNLNQYDSVGGKNIGHDAAGNLTSYDGWSYNYNAHNRMTSATKSGTALSLTYDPTGRLESSTLNGSKTSFLYDGEELVGEYNSSGVLVNRYVHGIAEDDPLIWYIGSGTSNSRYLLADERGSIVAETTSSGAISTTHQYGPYGEPESAST